MSNDPGSPGGERPGWQGQQPPQPGAYGQPPAAPPPGGYGQHPGYGQSPPGWSQQSGQYGATTPAWAAGGPAGLGPGGVPPQNETRSFFGAVFDFSFNTFATPVVIRILYILSMLGIGLFYVISVIGSFAQGVAYGLATLVFGAVLALLALIYTRVGLELLYAVVRIAEDVRLLRNRP
jgi:hypothetical protein